MIVLDASALVEAVVGGASRGWVLETMEDHDVQAPAHQPAEVLSALRRMVRAGALTPSNAAAALDRINDFPQSLVLPTARHLRRALDLGGRLRVTDALYVALAEELTCPLLTTDLRLARAHPPCEVLAPTG